MTNIRNALMQAAGSAGGDPVYVEDVFSTHLYTGTGSGITINNGIDLSGEGGLVIYRRRDGAENWSFQDTERGVDSVIYSDSTSAAANPGGYGLASFNSNGFTTELNTSSAEYASWTFRKQAGFFDVVEFSTTGGGGQQTISHNLGSIPGTIIIKQITSGADGYWYVFHKSVTSPQSDWWLNYANLNITAAFGYWGSTNGIYSAPTSSGITLSTYFTNQTADFIAYFFAEGGSGDQIFGDDGDEPIIKCGSYTGDGGAGTTEVNLGFEPQWILVKASSAADSWFVIDNMRGWATDNNASNDAYLYFDSSNAESTGGFLDITSTGFRTTLYSNVNVNARKYVYVAIRRGPMKEPSAGTDVYIQDESHPSSYESPFFQTPWPVDFGLYRKRTASPDEGNYASTRITGKNYLVAQNNSAGSIDNAQVWDFMNGYYDLGSGAYADYSSIMFRRYPKVFDISVVKSTTSSAANYSHNLGVAPEFFISKRLDGAGGWILDQVDYYLLMSNSADLGSQYTVFENLTATTYGAKSGTFSSGETHLVLMFASLDGISKVGTYTGTGNDVNVTGLGAAARFVLIKRTDSSGDWYVFDSTVQGIVSGNDPYWILSSNAADVTNTDYIDPHSSGFTITSSAPADLNTSGGTYRYLAIS